MDEVGGVQHEDLGAMRSELETVSETLTKVNTTLSQFHDTVNKSNKSVAGIENRLDKHDDRLQNMQLNIETTCQNITKIQTEVALISKLKEDLKATNKDL